MAVHTAFVQGRLFVDEQERGPFAYWQHRHEFLPDGDGCLLRDNVTFMLPLRMDLLFGWLVKKELCRMFTYRHAVTAREAVRTGPAA